MKIIIKLLAFIIILSMQSCGKEFLDMKQDQRVVVPNSLDDFLKLLNNIGNINQKSALNLGIVGADEYFVTDAQFNTTGGAAIPEYLRNAYIWADRIYVGREIGVDWTNGYSTVMYANLALEYIEKTPRTEENKEKWNLLKGTASFLRALNYYNLAQLYCPVYDPSTANSALGLSLRKDSDPTVIVPRGNVQATYDMILADLSAAAPLLQDKPDLVFGVGKSAVYALLCRVNMQMGNYIEAEHYADECLKIQGQLLDFNTLNLPTTTTATFGLNGENNPEIIFMDNTPLITIYNYVNADPVLLHSYENTDLRLLAYWTTPTIDPVKFKGSYKGSNNTTFFTGLATDEVYLNRAECRIRNAKPQEALSDLNLLRKNRILSDDYTELQSSNNDQIMEWILAERRKELVFRGTRWPDLRRLNKEPKYATTLVRNLLGIRYELKPGDIRWTWPLPVEAIQNGGYVQNPR